MAKKITIICDLCGKEMQEADSVVIYGTVTVGRRYVLCPDRPNSGCGVKEEKIFGNTDSNQVADCCPRCYEKLEKRLDPFLKKIKAMK